MAKFLAYLGDLSGSMAGCTWSHNKGGDYVRKRSIPTNPTTTKQTAARSILSTLSSGWGSISAVQRTQWNDWAAANPITDSLGQSIVRSGQQAFVGLNARLLGAGAVLVATPPAVTGPVDLVTATAVATAATGVVAVTYTVTPAPAGLKLAFWCTLPTPIGRNPNRAQARLIGYSAAAAASPQSFTVPYPAIAGQISNAWVCMMDAAGQVSAGKRINLTWV